MGISKNNYYNISGLTLLYTLFMNKLIGAPPHYTGEANEYIY